LSACISNSPATMAANYRIMILSIFLLYMTVFSTAAKILICSDSTTVNYTSGSMQGWGYYLNQFVDIPVLNLAKGGRSTRTFINEGSWRQLIAKTSPKDFVIIEMGHNDDVNPSKNDKYSDRGVLPGLGNESKVCTLNSGRTEKVFTFGHYLRIMIDDVKKKDAFPILSGMVPRNYWKNNKLQDNWAYAKYEEEQAKMSRVEYVDHTKYSVKRFQAMGKSASTAMYADGATHTNAKGAMINAETFIESVKCAKSQLANHLKPKGAAVNTKC
jgi:rhamnogalacturonan acetylesterase